MKQEINFYRGQFRSERRIFGTATMLGACVAILATMLMMYAFARQEVGSLDNELHNLSLQQDAALRRLDQLQPLLIAAGAGQTWAQRLDEANSTLQQKQLVLSLVQGSVLGDTHGFSRYLRSLARQDVEELWLTRVILSPSGDQTKLQGNALRAEVVATYLQGLAQEPPFARQRFNQFQIETFEDQDDIVFFSMNSDPQTIAGTMVTQ